MKSNNIEKYKQMRGYLAQPYTDNPEQSFKLAKQWSTQLIIKGFFVYSPVAESHPIWMEIKNNIDQSQWPPHDIWIKRDFAFIKGWKNNDGNIYICKICGQNNDFCFCSKCECEKHECQDTYRKYDSGVFLLMSKTAYVDKIPFLMKCSNHTCFNNTIALMSKEKYDICPKCKSKLIFSNKTDKEVRFWESTGCRQEYEFAKENYIQVLELESFLQGVVKEI